MLKTIQSTQKGLLNRSTTREIVFIDSSVEDSRHLIAGVNTSISQIFLLDATKDGVVQIGELLAQYSGLKAIHIVSHGIPGSIQLGTAHLAIHSLQYYSPLVKGWADALASNADILIYGCRVAEGDTGLALLEELHQLTQANVAASTALVGNPEKGGKWTLDYEFGSISTSLAFQPQVMATYSGVLEASAFLKVDPPATGINSSTFSSGSFTLTNNSTSGQRIRRIFIDTSKAFLPDIVFDPFGTGGDTIAKPLTIDSNSGVGTISTNYFLPVTGGGFQGLELLFTDFQVGQTLTFSIDMDPTSTKGTAAPGPGESASVSGLEMIGSIVTVEFDDNTTITGSLYRVPGSVDGSQVFLKPNQPTAPTIEILGVSGSQAIVESASQTVRITGTVGSQVSLLLAGAAMFTKSDGTAYDIDPFEANSVTGVTEITATIGASGFVDVPITLSTLSTQNGYAGFNYIMAAQKNADGTTGLVSNVQTLQLNLPSTPTEVVIEAENFVLNTFRKETLSSASNGMGISFIGSAAAETGTAYFDFTGAASLYDIYISYWDENDGTGSVNLSVNGTQLGTVTFNESTNSASATSSNKREARIAQAVSLQQGSRIQLQGFEQSNEATRIDYIRLVPVSGTPTNTAPTTTGITNISVVQNAPDTVINLFNVYSDAQDPDTALTYSVIGNTNAALFEVAPSINPTNGQLTLNYSPTATGTSQMTLRATDTAGLFTDTTFTVNVAPSAPVGEIKIEAESMVLSGFKVENLSGAGASGGQGISFVGGASGETGTAHFDFAGAAGLYDIFVTFWDESDGNSRLELLAGGTLINTLTFNQSSGGTTATTTNKREVKLAQAVSLQSGTRIQLRGFEDASEHARTDFIRLVPVSGTPTNTAPGSTGIANVTVVQNAPDTVINLFNVFSDLQDPDTALTYSIVGNTNAALFEVAPSINPTTGALTLNYSPTGAGTSQVTVRATDTGGLSTDTSFTVNVSAPANTAPTTSGIANVTVVQNAPDTVINLFNAFADAQDSDTALTYSVVGNTNAGLFEVVPSINPTTGALTLNYSPTATGTSQITVQATDTAGLSTTTSFTVTVNPPSQPIPPGDILIEAENMVLTGYRKESSSGIGAYGGQLITFVNGGTNETGTAHFDYSGAADTYDLNLAFWDESDGNASFEVYVNGTLRGTVLSNRNVGGSTATVNNKWEIRAVENLTLNPGDRIQVKGFENSGDAARLDYVRLTKDKTIRINTGTGTNSPNTSALYTDTSGYVWGRDTFAVSGTVSAVPSTTEIFKTDNDALYRNVRSAKDLSYQIPVAEGAYTLKLHFVELTKTNYGQRVFDVKVEGDLVLDDLDIYEESKNAFFPGNNSALVKTIDQPFFISDGILNLDLNASVDNASIAAIEVIPLQGPAIIVKQSDGSTQVNEAVGNDTYEIVLNTRPTANVTISVNPGNQLNTNRNTLVFTPDNWDIPQMVTVTAINDTAAEGIHYTTITHSASSIDSAYNNAPVRSVPVTVLDDDVVAISFTKKIVDITNVNDPGITADDAIANVSNPTVGAWGPDGRLYVGFYDGSIRAYTFDDNYNVTGIQAINTIKGLYNDQILGLAFNPYDTEPKLYVSHSKLYANGGSAFPSTQLSPYSGEVSVLSGPTFSTHQSLISGIGVSNHDHGVNGLEFDNQGNLYIAVGGNTNAGITADEIGGVPESPFSAAILKAEITKPNFNGKIEYSVPAGSIIPTSYPTGYTPPPGETIGAGDHQLNGEVANVVPGVDVSVYASGLRNSFDLVFTTQGKIYATDNGANAGFGDFSTSATTQQPMGSGSPDELNLITQGAYYGSPNRNRGRTDARQNVYNNSLTSTDDYTAPLTTMTASTNGIVEYRATTFNGQLRGNLFAQDWNGPLYRFRMNADGTQVTQKDAMTGIVDGLDLLTGPGGVLVSVDLSEDAIAVATPNDAGAVGMTVYDVFPWRAPVTGGQSFVLGGANFGTLADTTVMVGEVAAQLTSVSGNRIRGVLPTLSPTNGDLLDIVVSSAGQSYTLTDAFLPLG